MDTLRTGEARTLACLCGESRARRAFGGRFSRLSGGRDLLRCGDCGLIRTSPSPIWRAEDATSPYRDENYFSGAEIDPGLWSRMQGPIVADLRAFSPGVDVLDVGCGMGFLVNAARAAGFSALGIDINPHAVAAGNRIHGLDLRVAGIDSIPDGSIHAVVANHVIEHVPEPRVFLAEARRCLRPGGVLVLGVPNVNGGVPRFLRALNRLPAGPGSRWVWFGYQLDQHLWHFDPRTLPSWLEKQGWEILAVHSDENMYYGALDVPRARYRALRSVWRLFELAGAGDNLRVVCRPA